MDLIDMTKDIVLEIISLKRVQAADIPQLLHHTYQALSHIVSTSVPSQRPPPRSVPRTWQESIGEDVISCLECGASFMHLSAKHLRLHGLDRQGYRAKWHIPLSQALCSADLTRRRRNQILSYRPWEGRMLPPQPQARRQR